MAQVSSHLKVVTQTLAQRGVADVDVGAEDAAGEQHGVDVLDKRRMSSSVKVMPRRGMLLVCRWVEVGEPVEHELPGIGSYRGPTDDHAGVVEVVALDRVDEPTSSSEFGELTQSTSVCSSAEGRRRSRCRTPTCPFGSPTATRSRRRGGRDRPRARVPDRVAHRGEVIEEPQVVVQRNGGALGGLSLRMARTYST